MADTIADILTAIVPLLAAICGWAVGKLRSAKKRDDKAAAEMAALKNGVKGLLRAKVIDLGLHYLETQAVPPYGIDTLRSCYDPYMALGDGDPAVSHIMHQCEELPVRYG